MSAIEILSLQMTLDTKPGGIPPVLHLKKGASSLGLTIYFRPEGLVLDETKTCIVKGTRPDGSELYITTVTLGSGGNIRIMLASANMKKLSEIPGKYLAEATIFDTKSGITRRNISLHDTVTTAKFYVDVEDSAYREEEA